MELPPAKRSKMTAAKSQTAIKKEKTEQADQDPAGGPASVAAAVVAPSCSSSSGSVASRVAKIAAALEMRRQIDKARIDRIQAAAVAKHDSSLQHEAVEAHQGFARAEARRGRDPPNLS